MKQNERRSAAANQKNSPFLLLLILTLLIRGGVLFISLSSFNDDPDGYARLAENWSSYGIFGTGDQATAFRPPLYPWTLKELAFLQTPTTRSANGKTKGAIGSNLALSRNASIALLHWIIGLATVLLVYRLALYADLSQRSAAFASLLVAVDPILLQQSRLVMTETLAAFFSAITLLGIVVCIQKRSSRFSVVLYLVLGVLFGLSTLCRPAFFAFVGLVFLCFLAIGFSTVLLVNKAGVFNRVRTLKNLSNVVFLLLGLGVVVVPWAVRNLHEFHRPILTTTHGGYTLYLANNPELYRHYQTSPPWSLWNPQSFHERREKQLKLAFEENNIEENTKEAELFQDKWTRQEAQKTVSSSPQTFLYSCFIRVGELWRLVPNDVDRISSSKTSTRTYLRYAVGCFYAFELFFAFVGLFCGCMRRNYRKSFNGSRRFLETPLLWGILLILSVQIPHLIYWTNMRMRAPLEAFLPILTVIGIQIAKEAFFSKLNKSLQSV
ncbi:MAG: phospholipid carrier-dependent glycosyltransferase [Thermoguttaceae bacterium]|nr:phospholipid carrier-dependent glycosyltransferase [Thermoguttaceae bacterium]